MQRYLWEKEGNFHGLHRSRRRQKEISFEYLTEKTKTIKSNFRRCQHGKMLLLILNQQDEKVIDKIISVIAEYVYVEPMQAAPIPVLSFLGLKIRQQQRWVLQNGVEVSLYQLVFTKQHVQLMFNYFLSKYLSSIFNILLTQALFVSHVNFSICISSIFFFLLNVVASFTF